MEPLEKLDEVFELDSDQECDLRPIDSDDSDDEFSLDLVQRLRSFETQTWSKQRPRNKVVEDDFEREVNAELTASLAAHCRRLAPGMVCDQAAPPPPRPEGTATLGAPPGGDSGATVTDTAQPPAATAAATAPDAGKKPEQEYYDDVYFDSDDDSAAEDGAASTAAAEAPAAADMNTAAADTAEDGATSTAAAEVPAAADMNTAAADTAAAGGSSSGGGGGPPAADPSSRRSERRSRRRRPVLTNDQLLYDPSLDEQDQQWVDRQRQRYLATAQHSGSSNLQAKPQKLPHSDAVLNCPACMTMLCLDCQRHELYSNQYRAMFVFNCDVDTSQALRYRLKEPPRRRGRGRRGGGGGGGGDESSAADVQELYNPVKCATCTTEVAVFDSDEVYHFYNVIASHS